MKIEDDFLDQKHFDKLQKTIMGDYFTWFFRDFVIDKKNKKDPNFFFVHMVYYKSVVDPITMQVLEPVLQKNWSPRITSNKNKFTNPNI